MCISRDDLHYLMGTNMIAYLKMKGFEEVDVEFTDNNKVKYWFKNSNELHDTIREFKENKLIQEYVSQQNKIKDKIIELRTKRQ
jgi:ribosomal protein S18